MRNYNVAYMKMLRALQSFFEKYAEKIKDNAIIQAALALAAQMAVTIIRYREIQNTNTKGITLAKRDAKKLLAKRTFIISGALRTWAYDIMNKDIYNKVKRPESGIYTLSDTLIMDYVDIVKELVSENFEALAPYGVTQAKLDALEAALKEYKKQQPLPRQASAKKANATIFMRSALAELRELIIGKLDNAMLDYADSDPEFYGEYVKIREIIDPITIHNSLWGYGTDEETQQTIQYASLQLFLLGSTQPVATRLTTATGYYAFKSLEPGTYILKVTFENYDPLEVQIFLHPGQSKRFDFALRKTE